MTLTLFSIMFSAMVTYSLMVRQFDDDMQSRVQNEGHISEPFPVTNGVKQDVVWH